MDRLLKASKFMLGTFVRQIVWHVMHGFQRLSDSRGKAPTTPQLDAMRTALIKQLNGCDPASTRAVRLHVGNAKNAQQLWLLRSDVYHAISNQFGQEEAERRMGYVSPMFKGFRSSRPPGRARR